MDYSENNIVIFGTKYLVKEKSLVWMSTQQKMLWSQGYKTLFILNSAEHEIFSAN